MRIVEGDVTVLAEPDESQVELGIAGGHHDPGRTATRDRTFDDIGRPLWRRFSELVASAKKNTDPGEVRVTGEDSEFMHPAL